MTGVDGGAKKKRK